MWAIQGYLARHRRDIDGKYDFRYSQFVYVFGRLGREGRVHAEQLRSLSEEKLSYIERIASLRIRRQCKPVTPRGAASSARLAWKVSEMHEDAAFLPSSHATRERSSCGPISHSACLRALQPAGPCGTFAP